jgi:hypothetical protein
MLKEDERFDELLQSPEALKELALDPEALSRLEMNVTNAVDIIAMALANKRGLRILRDKVERKAYEKRVEGMSPERLVEEIDAVFDLGTAAERSKRRWEGDE